MFYKSVCVSDLASVICWMCIKAFPYGKSLEMAALPKHSAVNHFKPPATVMTRTGRGVVIPERISLCCSGGSCVYRDRSVSLTYYSIKKRESSCGLVASDSLQSN